MLRKDLVKSIDKIANNPESKAADLLFHQVAKWESVKSLAIASGVEAGALGLEVIWRMQFGAKPELAMAEFDESRCKMFGYCELDEELDASWKRLFVNEGYFKPALDGSILDNYIRAKKIAPNAVLLFRIGDFYEAFYDDAKLIAKTLGLTLTNRSKSDPEPIPMAGFPNHQLEGYIGKLIREGHRVAVIEELTYESGGKDVVRVVT